MKPHSPVSTLTVPTGIEALTFDTERDSERVLWNFGDGSDRMKQAKNVIWKVFIDQIVLSKKMT